MILFQKATASRNIMKSGIYLCLLAYIRLSASAPANGIRFPDDRQDKKLEPVITPPVLPVLEHLERDPSTLLPGDSKQFGPSNPGLRNAPTNRRGPFKPKFGGFSAGPNGNGGFSGSVSSSGGGPGLSHAASQSFSFGFNNGFSASQSASQSASFSGFGGSSNFAGSQASSQAASFGGNGISSSASQAASIAGGGFGGHGGHGGPGFGFNSGSPYETPYDEVNFGEGALDIRHRGAPNFQFPSFVGRGRGIGAAAFRSNSRKPTRKSNDDWVTIVVSD